MDFQNERVKAHNNWPQTTIFKGEQAFKTLLAIKGGNAPFCPVPLGQDRTPDYQRCVAHFLDALEALPHRPDYFFDNSFRVLDLAATPIFPPRSGIKGMVQGVGGKLLKSGGNDWKKITEALCNHIPVRTCEFVAKQVLTALDNSDKDQVAIRDRAINCFGAQRYADFMAKFGVPFGTALPVTIPHKNIQKAGNFIKLYLSGGPATNRKVKASHLSLDLTNSNNIPNHNARMEILLSLLLFVVRNKRAHGDTMSPFRTSKSSIERFESYYFIMLAAYIFALGALQLRSWSGVTSSLILQGCLDNTALQKKFFP